MRVCVHVRAYAGSSFCARARAGHALASGQRHVRRRSRLKRFAPFVRAVVVALSFFTLAVSGAPRLALPAAMVANDEADQTSLHIVQWREDGHLV